MADAVTAKQRYKDKVDYIRVDLIIMDRLAYLPSIIYEFDVGPVQEALKFFGIMIDPWNDRSDLWKFAPDSLKDRSCIYLAKSFNAYETVKHFELRKIETFKEIS